MGKPKARKRTMPNSQVGNADPGIVRESGYDARSGIKPAEGDAIPKGSREIDGNAASPISSDEARASRIAKMPARLRSKLAANERSRYKK